MFSQSRNQDSRSRSSASGASSRSSPYSRGPRAGTKQEDGSWTHERYGSNPRASRSGQDDGASMSFPRDKSNDNDVKPTGRLTIENLHYDISQAELKELFEQIGPVVKAYIRYDRSGRSSGTAVVIYENPNHASTAKQEYDGAKAKGQVISITQELRADRPIKAETGNKSLLSRFDLSSRFNEPISKISFADRLGPVRGNTGTGTKSQSRSTPKHNKPRKQMPKKEETELSATTEKGVGISEDVQPSSKGAPATTSDDVDMAS